MGSPSKDDVLEAFALEDKHDGPTLERYLQAYPDYRVSLVDLARELTRTDIAHEEELSDADRILIGAAWQNFLSATSDRWLSGISPEVQRKAANELGVPRQVIIAIKDGQVIPKSIPRKVTSRLAAILEWTYESLADAVGANDQRVMSGLSFKSEEKPEPQDQLSFERLLIDAGVSEEKRAELLSDTD